MAPPQTRAEDPAEDAPASPAPRGEAAAIIAVAALAVCAVTLIVALVAGGAVTAQVIPGLPDAGALTRWGLPLSRTLTNLAGALTVGLLLLAAVLLPSAKGALSDQALGYVRAASWAALVWAAAAGARLVFELSNILGEVPADVIGNSLTSYAGQIAEGRALMATVLAATAVALFARTATAAWGALLLLAGALAGLVPPALTGHAAASGGHEMALTGLALHLLTMAVWVGGLAAVTFHGLRAAPQDAAVAVRRFSAIALWAFIGVAVSGVASALSRLYSLDQLYTTPYGLIMLAKVALFAVLGGLGAWHRRATVEGIASGGGRRLFVRLAGVELAVMGAVMGLATALSRTAPPQVDPSDVDPATAILGFPIPPPMSVQTLLTLWRPDLFFILLVAVLGGLYAAGVVRLRRRGDSWPWSRTVFWALGLAVIIACQLSGFATYSMVLFSAHMLQHMAISMLAPILLVLGAPATLALRALKPAQRRGDRGPREWLNVFLHSRYSQVVTHPAAATALFVLSPYALYFSPLFPTLMNSHVGHLAMTVHFLLSGFLFYWIIIGVDPGPRKVPFLLRFVLLLVVMGMHAFFGITIMMQSAPIAMDYYGQFTIPWSENVGADQYTGGGFAWAVGEIPTLLVTLALIRQWASDEERTERRRERHSRRDGSDDADLDAYNAYLQELERRSQRNGG